MVFTHSRRIFGLFSSSLKRCSFTGVLPCALFLVVLLLAAVSASAQAPPSPDVARFVVVLDAAHGGDDAGAKLGSQEEKDVTLAFAERLRSLLEARGMNVVDTRDADVSLDADHRAEIANHAEAAACLSLHATLASASGGPSVHLFLSSLPAAKDTSLLPWRTAQSAWIDRSVALAGVLNAALNAAGIPVALGRTPLAPMDSMTCPAAAIELAVPPFADAHNAPEAGNAAFSTKVADALAAALVEWRSSGNQPGGSPTGESRP